MELPIAVAIGGGVQRKGETLQIDRAILRMTKIRKPLVVFIPTASADREDYIDSSERYFQKLGATVHTLKLENRRPKAADYAAIMDADIFYFGAGDASHLYRKMFRSHVLKEIVNRYKAGAIIVGTSAGASILFPRYFGFNKLGRVESGTGLNILRISSDVFLHFVPLMKLPPLKVGRPIIAIPESGAVVFRGNEPLHSLGAKAFTFDYSHGKYHLRPLLSIHTRKS